jgi:outer membrane protein OmpA-like peptidoglycan-associated protein
MGAAIFAAILAAFIVFGKESRTYDESVTILPPPPGKSIGGVVLKRGSEEHLLNTPYASGRIHGTGQMQVVQSSQSEVHASFSDVLAALPPRPAKFMLYFVTGKDVLTPESEVELQSVLAEMKKRPSPDVLVIGHTDTQGGRESNDALSLQRAERMKKYLEGIGIPPERITVAGRGDRELLVPTGPNVDEPRNRRVEINVR